MLEKMSRKGEIGLLLHLMQVIKQIKKKIGTSIFKDLKSKWL